MSMKKVKVYKGFIIATDGTEFFVFTADEWSCGEGMRYAEMDCQSVSEAEQFIKSY